MKIESLFFGECSKMNFNQVISMLGATAGSLKNGPSASQKTMVQPCILSGTFTVVLGGTTNVCHGMIVFPGTVKISPMGNIIVKVGKNTVYILPVEEIGFHARDGVYIHNIDMVD